MTDTLTNIRFYEPCKDARSGVTSSHIQQALEIALDNGLLDSMLNATDYTVDVSDFAIEVAKSAYAVYSKECREYRLTVVTNLGHRFFSLDEQALEDVVFKRGVFNLIGLIKCMRPMTGTEEYKKWGPYR